MPRRRGAGLDGDPGRLRRDQRRGEDHAAVGPARSSRRVRARGRADDPGQYRKQLRPVPRPGRQVARQDARADRRRHPPAREQGHHHRRPGDRRLHRRRIVQAGHFNPERPIPRRSARPQAQERRRPRPRG